MWPQKGDLPLAERSAEGPLREQIWGPVWMGLVWGPSEKRVGGSCDGPGMAVVAFLLPFSLLPLWLSPSSAATVVSVVYCTGASRASGG